MQESLAKPVLTEADLITRRAHQPHYHYRVTWSEEDQEHVGLCDEFPGLSWLEKSPEAALAGIKKVVEETVAEMIEDGKQIHQPKRDCMSGHAGASP
jgi:predicted RNase H-like HicB family nuclease